MKKVSYLNLVFAFILFIQCSNEKNKADLLNKKNDVVKITGEKAPEIEFSKCLNADISKAFLNDKTIILEFWATWCAPCIAGFPHFNKLSEEFSSNDILFLSITKENNTEKIKKLLETKPLKAYNLIDKDSITSKRFMVNVLPKTFVIGKNGILLWEGYSKKLTKELLGELITNQKVIEEKSTNQQKKTVDESEFVLVTSYSDDQTPTEFGKEISATDAATGYYSWTINTWSFINFFGLQLNDINRTRIKSNREDFNIDLQYRCNTIFSNPKDKLINNLTSIYDFNFKVEKSTEECIYLEVLEVDKLKGFLSTSKKTSYARGKEMFILRGQSLVKICQIIERHYNEIVVISNQISDDAKYDIEFPNTDWGKLQEYLQNKYGLKFIQTQKEVEMLVLNFN